MKDPAKGFIDALAEHAKVGFAYGENKHAYLGTVSKIRGSAGVSGPDEVSIKLILPKRLEGQEKWFPLPKIKWCATIKEFAVRPKRGKPPHF